MPKTTVFPPDSVSSRGCPVSALALLAAALLPLIASAKSPEAFVGERDAPKAAAANPTPAVPAKPSKGTAAPMDTARVHEQYLEGEFDLAIKALESQLKTRRAMSHAESVFVFKHLGVMYAAQQSTREKGKHYMQELILIEPTAKILDMYASDMIHLIFRNVQEEFEAKKARLAPPPETVAVAATPVPEPAPSPPAEAPKSQVRKRTLFMAAAGAGVAVGALALFILLGEDDPETRTIQVTE